MPVAEDIFLSIIIPVYNGEDVVSETLGRIYGYFEPKQNFEMVVVDDGSRDGTAAAVDRFAEGKSRVKIERNGVNRGKGFSVRRGVAASRGSLCLFTDADMPVEISNADRFISILDEGYDMVIASRHAGVKFSFRSTTFKRVLSRIFNALVRLLFGFGYSDTQCGFKLMRAGVAKRAFSRCRINRFAFDVELIWFAERENARIREEPVACAFSKRSKVRLIADSAIMLKDILMLRIRTLGAAR